MVKLGKAVLVAAALALLAVCYGVALRAPAVGTYHDDGVYVVTAKALAQGDGYRIISLPRPLPQTKYPILFPFLLSLIWRCLPDFPSNAFFLKLLPFVAGLIWCAVSFRVIRARAGPGASWVIAWLTLASPWVLFLSTTILSETTFAALAWSALLLLDKLPGGGKPTRPPGAYTGEPGSVGADGGVGWVCASGLLAGAAVITRTIGVAVPAAATLWMLFVRRRRRAAAAFAAVTLAVTTPWFVWALMATKQVPADAGYYASSSYSHWTILWNFGWTDKLIVLLTNVVQTVLAPAKILGVSQRLLVPVGTVLGLLMLVGVAVRLRDRADVFDGFFLLSIGLVLFWPWPVTRFLVPMYPLILLYIWTGFRRLVLGLPLSRAGASRVRSVAVAAAFVLAATGLVGESFYIARSGISWPVLACRDRWTDYQSIASWVKGETRSDAVLLSTLDPLFYLYTGRKADRAFSAEPVELYYKEGADREPLGPPSRLIDRMRVVGADYLIDAPGSCFGEAPFLRRQIDAVRRDAPQALEPVAGDEAWAQWIFRRTGPISAPPTRQQEDGRSR